MKKQKLKPFLIAAMVGSGIIFVFVGVHEESLGMFLIGVIPLSIGLLDICDEVF